MVGIIAGGGRLPVLTAAGIRASGRRVACVGLAGQYDPSLPAMCDAFAPAGVSQLGKWIRLLHRWGASETVLVGTVRKVSMYQPYLWLRYMPDWRAAKLWYFTARRDRRTDRLLTGLADTLAEEGIHLMDSTHYIPEQMASEGVLTKNKPSASQAADVDFALPIVLRMGDLDIGQSIAVKDCEVIAVEAIEGTDGMIRRAGELCPSGKWTMVKVAKPRQDLRFDVPTVGLKTIESLRASGGTCLAVEAGRVILLDKPAFLKAAEQAGIAVVGVRIESAR